MRAFLPVILAAVASAGCHTMRPMPLDMLSAARPSRIWVTSGDSVILLTDPQIVNNRLAGFADDTYHVIPAAEVETVAVRRINPLPTAALVTAGAAAAVTAMFLLSGTDSDYQHPCTRLKATCDENEAP